MMMPITDFHAYGELVYSLQALYPGVSRSTLVLASIGPTLAKVEGQMLFEADVVLDVWELVDFEAHKIRNYSYEIYHAGEKIAWYDPFEHPDIPELASTHPHHKHIPPDLKRNRIPAPDMSFEEPNIPTLIEEIEREIIPFFLLPADP
jgi:hypothetical protein